MVYMAYFIVEMSTEGERDTEIQNSFILSKQNMIFSLPLIIDIFMSLNDQLC